MTIEFTIERDALVWTGDGETLRIEAWGANLSLIHI